MRRLIWLLLAAALAAIYGDYTPVPNPEPLHVVWPMPGVR